MHRDEASAGSWPLQVCQSPGNVRNFNRCWGACIMELGRSWMDICGNWILNIWAYKSDAINYLDRLLEAFLKEERIYLGRAEASVMNTAVQYTIERFFSFSGSRVACGLT